MSDVFISYSRDDSDFTYNLCDALGQSTRLDDVDGPIDYWIDKDDIEYSVEWWGRICKGIEDANNFAVVVSNNYLGSQICNEELIHALRLSKPIIPIILSPIDKDEYKTKQQKRIKENKDWDRQLTTLADTNAGELSKINWIEMSKLGFDGTVSALVQSMFQDIEYKDGLREWGNRAEDWEKLGRSYRSLLTGNDLDSAEQWRDKAITQQLRIEPLVVDFVNASRLSQRRNQQQV